MSSGGGSTSARKYAEAPSNSYERRPTSYASGAKRSRSRSKDRHYTSSSSAYHKDSGANREIRPGNVNPPAPTFGSSSAQQKRKDSGGAGSEEGEIKKKSS